MGYSIVTTVLSAAASYDLTDLATAKDELSLSGTSSDTWLSRAVSQVSRAMATHTKRVFAPEVVQDAFDIQQDLYPYQTPGGLAELTLSRWPVLAVISVAQTLAPGTMQMLTEGTDFRIDSETGRLIRINPFTGSGSTWEAAPVTVIYLAGFGAQVTETHTVPATPYKVTVSGAASFSCDQSVKYASGTALTRVTGSPTAGQYSVSAGVYTFAAADTGQSLSFAYGIRNIPDDLVEICLRLVTARYHSKDRDPSLVQRETPGVGMERWWFGGAPGQSGPFPPDIEAALDPYRMPVLV